MLRGRTAEQWAGDRNLCGAVVAVAGAAAGLCQAAGAPVAARIVLGAIAILAGLMALAFHLLERRAPRTTVSGVSERRIPRGDLKKPLKFVNRSDELARLDELLDRTERGNGPLVVVLGGLPGVGKSAMGRYWADRVRGRFGDGDLVADFSSRRRGVAVDVSGVLADFIRELGPPDAVMPVGLAGRVERFRAMTADRKVLVLLDDVTEAAHVTQLRPSGSQSVVVATSYRSLEELYYEGAEFVPVDPLSEAKARDLLTAIAGAQGDAVSREPEATAQLIEYCGGLPLPLCVCATRLMLARGARTVREVVADVADEQRRLDYLAGKGEYAGAAVFGFAYNDLAAGERETYRWAGMHPGLDISAEHIAVLTETETIHAAGQLSALADTHLIDPVPDGRFRFHDLVRLHARECVEREEGEATRDRRLAALVDWYRAALRAADWALIGERIRLAPVEPIPAPDLPLFTSREAVFEWLERERANILAVLQCARDREWDVQVWHMVESLWLYYYNRRHYADWIDATEIGVECAQRAKDRDAEARMRAQLAWAFVELGHYERAHEQLDRATSALADSSHLQLRGSVREFVGGCFLKEGDYDAALAAYSDSREVFLRAGSSRGVALQDYFIGWALLGKGAHQEALVSLRAALETMRTHDDQMFVGRLLLRIGQATLGAGVLEGAETTLREALDLFGTLGMRLEEAETYEALARVAEGRTDHQTADAERERAQAIYRTLGHPRAGEPSRIVSSAIDPLAL